MSSKSKLREIIENHVPGLPLMLTVFAIIEIGILLVCVIYSADQEIVKIYNANNEVVYEDDYNINSINEFKKIYGIRNFKKEGFVVTRVGIDNKFPTRAWIALSICVPLALVLFVVFIVKIFTDVFQIKIKDSKQDKKDKKSGDFETTDFEETKFEKVFTTLGRLNIYSLGFTILLIVFLYWMVPDFIIYMGKISYQTISEFKWVILGVILFIGVYMIIRVFLSHKARTEMIKQQTEIQKNRDRLVIEAKVDKKLLEDKSGKTDR